MSLALFCVIGLFASCNAIIRYPVDGGSLIATTDDKVIFGQTTNGNNYFDRLNYYDAKDNLMHQYSFPAPFGFNSDLRIYTSGNSIAFLLYNYSNFDPVTAFYQGSELRLMVPNYLNDITVVQDCFVWKSNDTFTVLNTTTYSLYNKSYPSEAPIYSGQLYSVQDCFVQGFSAYCFKTDSWTFFEPENQTFYDAFDYQDTLFVRDGHNLLTFNSTSEQWSTIALDIFNSTSVYYFIMTETIWMQGISGIYCYHVLHQNFTKVPNDGLIMKASDNTILVLNGTIIYIYNQNMTLIRPIPNKNQAGAHLLTDNILYMHPNELYNIAKDTYSKISLNFTISTYCALTGRMGLVSSDVALRVYSFYVVTACTSNSECSDGIFCNGEEYCDSLGICSSGDLPCSSQICNNTCNEQNRTCLLAKGTSCDNQKFCDGVDTCDGKGTCVHSGNPCSNLTICNTGCSEENMCTYSSYGSPCTGTDTCGTYICDGLGSCAGLGVSSCADKTIGKSSSNNTATVVGSVLGVIVFLLLAIGAVFIYIQRRRKNQESPKRHTSVEMTLYTIENVTILDEIGSGEFGIVYRGTMDDSIKVALKSLKGSEFSSEFQREIGVLSTLNHPNIVRLYGIHVSNNDRYMVFEYMAKGSLLSLVQSIEIPHHKLLQMSKQILAGMKYLEANRIVHRDLALRNVLVSLDETGEYFVKVSDFGMSRAVEKGYYKTEEKKMPIKWSAPEFIQYGKSTSKSDVWSFGICLWELFSCGKVPYIGWTNDIVIERVLSGFRMSPPPNCPDSVYDVMYSCWNVEPEKRPNFAELHQKISAINLNAEKKQEVVVETPNPVVISEHEVYN